MRTGTQLFLLCLSMGFLFVTVGMWVPQLTIEMFSIFSIFAILYVLNIVREHLYVQREARLQEFEVAKYWEAVEKHPEILSERIRRAPGFES